MAKTRQQKKKIIEKLTKELSASKSVVMADYQGLTVEETEELRNQLYAQGAVLRVVKNKLAAIALKESELDATLDATGQTAYAIGLEDEVAPAKILYDFAKKHEALELKSGLLGNKVMTLEEVQALAQLPSKEEMIAKTVATIKAPITGFVTVMGGNLRGLVQVLAQVRDAKGDAN
ncbi:MAG: 50S ribosomal protein L10 [Candidatus Doudnabacteria bacterium]|nr:50S ribosomal protein L10 [Candidatus Doudnabacteria bacterium]MCA9387750.1 50S ribosomal protein L10 [Candidatus Andersenbacteria bacterium]